MKRLFVLCFPVVGLLLILSITALAQSPSPVVSPTATPTSIEAAASPSPVATQDAAPGYRPDLPFWVAMAACGVMLGSVLVVFLLVRQQQTLNPKRTMEPRHIQFVSVCLIVPTILILGLVQWLSKETTATLLGGLTGYLLSGLGKEPRDGRDGGGQPNKEGQSGTPTQGKKDGGDQPKQELKDPRRGELVFESKQTEP